MYSASYIGLKLGLIKRDLMFFTQTLQMYRYLTIGLYKCIPSSLWAASFHLTFQCLYQGQDVQMWADWAEGPQREWSNWAGCTCGPSSSAACKPGSAQPLPRRPSGRQQRQHRVPAAPRRGDSNGSWLSALQSHPPDMVWPVRRIHLGSL